MNYVMTVILALTLCSMPTENSKKGKISEEELTFLNDFMDASINELTETLNKVGEEEWNVQPQDGGWSAAHCMEHMLLAEIALFGQIKAALAEPANNEMSTRQKDAWLITRIADRGVKVKTPLPPKGNGKSKDQMLAELKAHRNEVKKFLKNRDLELRNHFGKSPYGPADCYQIFLVMAAHTLRHSAQINEVLNEIQA